MPRSRLITYAARIKPALPGGVIFFLTWLIYLQAIPYLMTTWAITGDEPHYLLAAHSLVHDHDLDLKNNYANQDYASFYSSILDPHVKAQPDGAQLLSHDIGLPLLLAPAYALGGRWGVYQFLAVVGALLAAQMFLLGWEVTRQSWAGVLAWLAMAFSAPLALYVFQIYPEMIGSLIILWALRQILGTTQWRTETDKQQAVRPTTPSFFLLLLSLALLPWLSGRYAPLLLFLMALAIWKWWPQRSAWFTLVVVALISLAAYLIVNFTFYGGPTPSATEAGNAVGSGFANVAGQQIIRGLAGWWLDQQRGLLVYGPILIVALIGLPHLWRLRGLEGLLLFAPMVGLWLLASVWGGFYVAWEISARFLMAGVPLLVAGVAAAFVGIQGRTRRVVFWPLAAGLLTLSIVNAVVVVLKPFVAYHESPIEFYEEATKWQLRQALPAMGTRAILFPPAGQREWQVQAGQAGYVYQSPAVSELSIGWYKVYAQAQVTGVTQPNQPVLDFDIYSSETGISLLHSDVYEAQADEATGLIDVALPFYNFYFNQWDFPFYLDIRSTGNASVRLSPVLLEADPWPTYGRVGAWTLGLVALTLCLAWPVSSRPNASLKRA